MVSSKFTLELMPMLQWFSFRTNFIAHVFSGLSPSLDVPGMLKDVQIYQLHVFFCITQKFVYFDVISLFLSYTFFVLSYEIVCSFTKKSLFRQNISGKECVLFSETTHILLVCSRVLLERLIVNRPHPWGLLITFIELIKNPQFKFMNHEFVHCAPEIEK